MRVFWAALALLALAGVWFIIDSPARMSEPAARPVPVPVPAPAPAPAPAPEQRTAPEPPSVPEPTAAEAARPDAPPAVAADPPALVLPPASVPPPPATDTRTPAEVTRRIDARTLELDGRFRIVGSGGQGDPYRINWELLTSAGPFVDPARNALTPPPWVRALDGVWIEISAYYSTAVRVSSTQSVLLTLNRWDGCCLGLPPTPFDAIDTSLAEPLELRGLHLFRFGTFRGRLEIEPFTAGPYLLGLYRLEDATFEAR